MQTTTQKNRLGFLTFQRKVFFNALIVLSILTMNGCKKEALAPVPVPIDDELAINPSWNYNELELSVSNDVISSSVKMVDIDGDHHDDYQVLFNVRTNGDYHISIFGVNNNKVVRTTENKLKEFEFGELINSQTSIWTSTTLIIEQQNGVTNGIGFGDLKTIGIYFKSGSKMHYGWLKLKSGLSRGDVHSIFIKSIGYEVQENRAIKAGMANLI